jgi:Uma2 family endonuclease
MAAKPQEGSGKKQVAKAGESTNGNVLRLDESKRYTYADYLTWNDGQQRELINGHVRLMPAPLNAHVNMCAKIGDTMQWYIDKGRGQGHVYKAPFAVRLPAGSGEKDNSKIYNVLQPAVCMVCDLSKIDESGCLGAPDMVVEMQSPSNIRYNLGEKYDLYEAAGVKEYWLVSPKMNVVTVFLLQDKGKFDQGIIYESGSKIPIRTLDGLGMNLNEIFDS